MRLEAEIEALTREIAERTDYESPEYEQLLHRLNDAQDHYHILGGETRDADIEKTLLGLGFKRSDFRARHERVLGAAGACVSSWRNCCSGGPRSSCWTNRRTISTSSRFSGSKSISGITTGAVLLISHDRAFLDNVTNRTVELSLGKITDYKVSYSKYVVLRAERRRSRWRPTRTSSG